MNGTEMGGDAEQPQNSGGVNELLQKLLAGITELRSEMTELTGRVAKVESQNEEAFRVRLEQLAAMPTPTGTGESQKVPDQDPVTDHQGTREMSELRTEETGREVRTTGIELRNNHGDALTQPPPTSTAQKSSAQVNFSTNFGRTTSTAADPADSLFFSSRRATDHTYILQNLRSDLERGLPPSMTGIPATFAVPDPPTAANRLPGAFPTLDPADLLHNTSSPQRSTPSVMQEEVLMEYDGSFPWQDYQVHLESVAFVNRWDERTTAAKLVPKLRGPVLHFVAALGPNTWTDYRQLLYLLQNRFGVRRNVQTAHNELRRRSQRTGESLDIFAREVERLTRLAYPNWPDHIINQLALEQFMDGIADAELQLMVRTRTPKTTTEACLIGQAYLDHRAATRTAQRVLRVSAANLDLGSTYSHNPEPVTSTDPSKTSGNDLGSA